MIRIAVVEDDKNYAESLIKYIKRYEEESDQHFQVFQFSDGEDITENYTASYDIILMDIEMQFMDGMTAAEKIREVDSDVVIIFITHTPQYAMKGYAVDALDYVLKPINYFAFSQRIDRALQRMTHRAKRYITIATKTGARKIDISSINYVEVLNHDLYYHTTDGVFTIRGTMRELEESLAEESFFRCNKGYLVNLENVEGFEGSTVFVGGEEVAVSRSRKKELLDAINDYMNEVSK